MTLDESLRAFFDKEEQTNTASTSPNPTPSAAPTLPTNTPNTSTTGNTSVPTEKPGTPKPVEKMVTTSGTETGDKGTPPPTGGKGNAPKDKGSGEAKLDEYGLPVSSVPTSTDPVPAPSHVTPIPTGDMTSGSSSTTNRVNPSRTAKTQAKGVVKAVMESSGEITEETGKGTVVDLSGETQVKKKSRRNNYARTQMRKIASKEEYATMTYEERVEALKPYYGKPVLEDLEKRNPLPLYGFPQYIQDILTKGYPLEYKKKLGQVDFLNYTRLTAAEIEAYRTEDETKPRTPRAKKGQSKKRKASKTPDPKPAAKKPAVSSSQATTTAPTPPTTAPTPPKPTITTTNISAPSKPTTTPTSNSMNKAPPAKKPRLTDIELAELLKEPKVGDSKATKEWKREIQGRAKQIADEVKPPLVDGQKSTFLKSGSMPKVCLSLLITYSRWKDLQSRLEANEPLKKKQSQEEQEEEAKQRQREAKTVKEMMEYKKKWETSQKEMEAKEVALEVVKKEFMEMIASGAIKRGELERKVASLEGINQHHLKRLEEFDQLKTDLHKGKRENKQLSLQLEKREKLVNEATKSLEEAVPGPKYVGLISEANIEIKATMMENGKLRNELKELKSDMNTARNSYDEMEKEKEEALSELDKEKATNNLVVENYKNEIRALQEKLDQVQQPSTKDTTTVSAPSTDDKNEVPPEEDYKKKYLAEVETTKRLKEENEENLRQIAAIAFPLQHTLRVTMDSLNKEKGYLDKILEYAEDSKEEFPQNLEAVKNLLEESGKITKITGSFPRLTGDRLGDGNSDSEEEVSTHDSFDPPLSKSARKAGYDKDAQLNLFEDEAEEKEETVGESETEESESGGDLPETPAKKRRNLITSDTEESSPGKV